MEGAFKDGQGDDDLDPGRQGAEKWGPAGDGGRGPGFNATHVVSPTLIPTSFGFWNEVF